jgi:hypothetical protein
MTTVITRYPMAIVLLNGASSPTVATGTLYAVHDEGEGQEFERAMHDAELAKVLVTAS